MMIHINTAKVLDDDELHVALDLFDNAMNKAIVGLMASVPMRFQHIRQIEVGQLSYWKPETSSGAILPGMPITLSTSSTTYRLPTGPARLLMDMGIPSAGLLFTYPETRKRKGMLSANYVFRILENVRKEAIEKIGQPLSPVVLWNTAIMRQTVNTYRYRDT